MIGPWPKKVETMEPPQNRRFYGKMECLSLWPTYIGEKGRTLGKTNGIKATCYWEHPWGTHWEPRQDIGNPFGKFFRKTSSCQKFPHFVRKMDNNENIFKEITRVKLTKDIGMNIKTLSTRECLSLHKHAFGCKLEYSGLNCMFNVTSVAYVVGPSVNWLPNYFFLQKYLFDNLIEFSMTKILDFNFSRMLGLNISKSPSLNLTHQDISNNVNSAPKFFYNYNFLFKKKLREKVVQYSIASPL